MIVDLSPPAPAGPTSSRPIAAPLVPGHRNEAAPREGLDSYLEIWGDQDKRGVPAELGLAAALLTLLVAVTSLF